MRTTRRLLLLGLLLIVAVVLVRNSGWWRAPQPAASASHEAFEGVGARVFLADQAAPLQFSLTARDARLRLWLNANVAGLTPGTELDDGYYEVRVSLLDARGEVLRQLDWHHRLLVNWQNGANGPMPRRVYLGDGVGGTPAATNLMYLHADPQARTLKVELLPQASHRIGSVAVRVYSREQLGPSEVQRRLQRVSAATRASLARHNVYDWGLMDAAERRNAIANHWRPLVPIGNPGLDFRDARLVLRDADDAATPEPPPPVDDNLVTPERVRSFALREVDNRVTIRMRPLAAAAGRQAVVTWYGRLRGERRTWRLPADGVLTLQLGRGLLELATETPVQAEVSDAAGDVLPAAESQVRAWLVTPQRPLQVELAGWPETVPLRIDARALAPGRRTVGMSARVTTDAGPRRLGSWSLPVAPDRHAWLPDDPDTWLGQLARSFVRAPPGSRMLELTVDAAALVTVADRPAALPRRQRIPEGLYGGGEDDVMLAWFLLDPVDAVQRLTDEGSRMLTVAVQAQTPADTDEPGAMIDGLAERLLPRPPWRGASVFEPLPPGVDPPLFALYVELPAGGRSVQLIPRAGLGQVQPRLLLERNASGPVEVLLDGQVVDLRQAGRGWVGVRLPPLPGGNHRLATRPPRRMLVSHPAPAESGPRWRERLVLSVADGLDFDVSRPVPTGESIAVRVYAADAQRERVRLRLRLTGLGFESGVAPVHTFARHDVDLRLDRTPPLPLVDADATTLVRSGVTFVPVGTDVSRHNAWLEVRVDGPSEGLFVSVTGMPTTPQGRADIFTASEAQSDEL